MKLPPVVLNKELHALIGTVKEMDLITTYEEVLDGLRKYIVNKKLFDESNPSKVLCKDDELGCVLGIEEFTVSDLKTLLQRIVVPLNKAYRDSAEADSLSSDNPLKRKNDESSDSGQRKVLAVDVEVHTSPLILHVPPSPTYFSMSDSVDSIQGYETTFVKDTSDDFLSTENGEERILAIQETYNIEYEVETDSDDSSFSGDSSDTESDEETNPMVFLNAAIMTFLTKPESDIEFFADDSSDNDDGEYDIEISESDFWVCKTCGISNQPPMRYCLKCFEERVNWLPDKPLRKKRKSRKSVGFCDQDPNEASVSKCDQDSQGSSSSGVCSETKESTSDPSSNLLSPDKEFYHFSTDAVDLPSTSVQCTGSIASFSVESAGSLYIEPTDLSSVESLNLPADNSAELKIKKLDHLSSVESFCMKSINLSCIESSGLSSMPSSCPSSMESASSIESSCLSSIESTCSSGTEPTSSLSMESTSKLCLICCANPASASIIHGKYAHQISCYKCARKLKKQKKGCPVCRRTIDRVVHQINI